VTNALSGGGEKFPERWQDLWVKCWNGSDRLGMGREGLRVFDTVWIAKS